MNSVASGSQGGSVEKSIASQVPAGGRLPYGRWRTRQGSTENPGWPDQFDRQFSSDPEREVHMLYCCQNHSGSPVLAAPTKRKAPTPCATFYGFDSPSYPSSVIVDKPPAGFKHTASPEDTGADDADVLIAASAYISDAQQMQEAAQSQADQPSSHASFTGNNGSNTSCILSQSTAQTHQHKAAAWDNSKADQHPVLHSLGKKCGKSFSVWPLQRGHNDELHQSLLSAAALSADNHVAITHDSSADTASIASIDHHSPCLDISSPSVVWNCCCSLAAALRLLGKQCWPAASQPAEGALPTGSRREGPAENEHGVHPQHQWMG